MRPHKRSASALVLCIGFLMFLSMAAISFVRLASIQMKATQNHVFAGEAQNVGPSRCRLYGITIVSRFH